jgi:hypothetical protein
MKLETKFSIGDQVFVVAEHYEATKPCDHCNVSQFRRELRVKPTQVESILCQVDLNKIVTSYIVQLNSLLRYDEQDIFLTSKEAAEHRDALLEKNKDAFNTP